MKSTGMKILGFLFLIIVYEYNNYAGACLAGLTLIVLLINSTDLFEV